MTLNCPMTQTAISQRDVTSFILIRVLFNFVRRVGAQFENLRLTRTCNEVD